MPKPCSYIGAVENHSSRGRRYDTVVLLINRDSAELRSPHPVIEGENDEIQSHLVRRLSFMKENQRTMTGQQNVFEFQIAE